MRNVLRLLLVSLLFWSVIPQGAAGQVSPVIPPGGSGDAADFQGVRRAVLVGVNEYQHLGHLKYAGADVEALGKALTNAGFSERNVVVIHDKATRSLLPDKGKIMKQIELTLDSCGPDDLVFLAFCMHGVRIDGKTYLAPFEADVPRFDGDSERLNLFIPIDWVYEQLRNCRARMKLMMVDACQERIFEGDTRSLTAEQKRLQSLDEIESPAGIMQMVACAPGEYSYEDSTLGHGVYTHFLLEALSGKADTNHDGIVTLKEVDLYVSRETNAYVREKYKSTQRPSIRGEMEGDLPLVEATKLSQITFPRDIPDLHLAINRLADNGILTIQPGVHHITRPLEISRDIQLLGATADPADTTLESTGNGCLVVTAGNARVQGLTLEVKTGKSESMNSNSAILVSQGQSEFRRCRITIDLGCGVRLLGGSADPMFVQCHFFSCGGVGVFVYEGGKGTFDKCEMYGNALDGIQISGENSNPKVSGCKVYNGKDVGISVWKGGKGTFDKCEVYGNARSGILLRENGDPTVTGCRIYNGKQCGILVNEGGKGTFVNCDAYGNVMAGIRVGGMNSTPKVSNCRFYNGLQGGIHVYDGGKGLFINCDVYGNALAGIEVNGGNSDPKMTGCRIHHGKSAGILVQKDGKGTFDNCQIHDNAFSGIQIQEKSDPKVTDCTIRDNKQAGIAVVSGSRGVYERNTLSGNAVAWHLDNPGAIRRTGNQPNQ